MAKVTYDRPGDVTWVMVTDAEIASDATLNEALPGADTGTVAHTAGYAVIKQKGLDGTWTKIGE